MIPLWYSKKYCSPKGMREYIKISHRVKLWQVVVKIIFNVYLRSICIHAYSSKKQYRNFGHVMQNLHNFAKFTITHQLLHHPNATTLWMDWCQLLTNCQICETLLYTQLCSEEKKEVIVLKKSISLVVDFKHVSIRSFLSRRWIYLLIYSLSTP